MGISNSDNDLAKLLYEGEKNDRDYRMQQEKFRLEQANYGLEQQKFQFEQNKQYTAQQNAMQQQAVGVYDKVLPMLQSIAMAPATQRQELEDAFFGDPNFSQAHQAFAQLGAAGVFQADPTRRSGYKLVMGPSATTGMGQVEANSIMNSEPTAKGRLEAAGKQRQQSTPKNTIDAAKSALVLQQQLESMLLEQEPGLEYDNSPKAKAKKMSIRKTAAQRAQSMTQALQGGDVSGSFSDPEDQQA